MPIYIDEIGHLNTDGDEEELHEFAAGIGLKRSWFQDKSKYPHCDCTTENMRTKAKRRGAIPISARDMILMLRDGTKPETEQDLFGDAI